MKKILSLFVFVLLLCSCNKQTLPIDPDIANAGPGDVVLVLNSSSSVEVSSRAASRAVVTPEWEKALKDVHIFIAKRTKSQPTADNDKVVSHTVFGPTALSAKKMIINLTSALDDDGAAFTFYAIANDGSSPDMQAIIAKVDGGVTPVTRKELVDLIESGTVAQYNSDTYEPVSIGSIRTGGFVMSGTDDNSGAGYSLDPTGPIKVDMTIKRTAVKLNITTAKSATFDINYPTWTTPSGETKTPKLKITNIKITKQLNNSNIFTQNATAQTGSSSPSTQTTSVDGAGSNLFYIYEQTSAVKIEVYADFALDGDFTNTATDNLVVAGPYKIDLTGGATTPAFVRNTCYNVKINVDGLSSTQISTSIKVEDWAIAEDQNINVGK